MMNERTFNWILEKEAVQILIGLDKDQRREYFRNLPIENVPMGSLMGASGIDIDDNGHVSFTITPQEFHYNPLGTVHGGMAATMLDSCNSISKCFTNSARIYRLDVDSCKNFSSLFGSVFWKILADYSCEMEILAKILARNRQ